MTDQPDMTRRQLLQLAACGAGLLAFGGSLAACRNSNGKTAPAFSRPGTLQDPDSNGLRLPPGFTSRIVARSSEPVLPNGYRWHAAPDGGACFPAPDNGWIYVSNSELGEASGGVGAIRFAADGTIVDAYPILNGSNRNCAGGPTPWGTWLSCEEIPLGQTWECDPTGINEARILPALGRFNHEAAAVDPDRLRIYLTEDRHDGCFYRYTGATIRNGIPDLFEGTLEVAEIISDTGDTGGRIRWHAVPDPSATQAETRHQVPVSTGFARGEGAWYHAGRIYFTTTADNRVWEYTIAGNSIRMVYDGANQPDPILTGNDNITVSSDGTLLVAEDGGNMQIVTISPDGKLAPLVEIADHPHSEVTGPAFDPSGKRLYFSSQRGMTGNSVDGITYEITISG